MNNLLVLWLSLSVSGALVAAALFLLKPALQHFSKKWQYYIWLLVILRLLIPISPAVSIVGGLFQQAKNQLTEQSQYINNASSSKPLETVLSHQIPTFENAAAESIPDTGSILMKEHLWGVIWLSAALVLFIRKVYGYFRFVRAVKKDNKAVTAGQAPAILKEAAEEMGVVTHIQLCTNPFILAPMLIGASHPVIILPEAIHEADLTYIFRHELTHLRRRDFLYKWLTELAVCLHWFNPVVYWVRRQINLYCEFSCDEAVISCLDCAERQRYGETLLNSITVSNRPQTHTVPLSLSGDGKLIKERLRAIMTYRHKSRAMVFAAAICAFFLLCGTFYAGAYTMAAVNDVSTSTEFRPIQISNKGLEPGGGITLGLQHLLDGTECTARFTWNGGSDLTILCAYSDRIMSYNIKSGEPVTFCLAMDAEYTFTVKNNSSQAAADINGSFSFQQNTEMQQHAPSSPIQPEGEADQTIVLVNTDMRRYEGEDGHPYIHCIVTNHTSREITGYQRGMLAFDKEGNPLKIDWFTLDRETFASYYYLYESTSTQIAPGETYDVFGGWSLNYWGEDPSVDSIAYVLFCDKEITFSDGTVWENPDFDTWRKAYEGKAADVDILKNYYPHIYTIGN